MGSSLAFIGFLEATALGGLVIAETQVRWWLKLCQGQLNLPSKEIMEDSVAADVVGSEFSFMRVMYLIYLKSAIFH